MNTRTSLEVQLRRRIITQIRVVAVVIVIAVIAGIVTGIHVFEKDNPEYEEIQTIFNFYCLRVYGLCILVSTGITTINISLHPRPANAQPN